MNTGKLRQLVLVLCFAAAADSSTALSVNSIAEDLHQLCVSPSLYRQFDNSARTPDLNSYASHKKGENVCNSGPEGDYDPRRIPVNITHWKCRSHEALLPGRCETQIIRLPVLKSEDQLDSQIGSAGGKLLNYRKVYIDWAIDCAFTSAMSTSISA